MTRRNAVMWLVICTWAIYYFTFQFHTGQEPFYPDGPFFTTYPTELLQDYRHVVLDYALSYLWVLLFVCVGITYALVAGASGRDFYRYAAVFWVAWLVQFAIQITFNLASPMRDPDRDLDFIREEVFPFSENFVGLKYGAFPSGHIGVTLLLFLLGRDRGIPWVMKLALVSEAILFFAVIYLGEHYLADAVASAILYPAIFFLVTRLLPPAEAKEKNDGEKSETANPS